MLIVVIVLLSQSISVPGFVCQLLGLSITFMGIMLWMFGDHHSKLIIIIHISAASSASTPPLNRRLSTSNIASISKSAADHKSLSRTASAAAATPAAGASAGAFTPFPYPAAAAPTVTTTTVPSLLDANETDEHKVSEPE